MLGIEQEFDAWKCQKAPTLKMRFPQDKDRSGQYRAILAAKEPGLTGSHLGGQLMDAEEIHPPHTLVAPWLSSGTGGGRWGRVLWCPLPGGVLFTPPAVVRRNPVECRGGR